MTPQIKTHSFAQYNSTNNNNEKKKHSEQCKSKQRKNCKRSKSLFLPWWESYILSFLLVFFVILCYFFVPDSGHIHMGFIIRLHRNHLLISILFYSRIVFRTLHTLILWFEIELGICKFIRMRCACGICVLSLSSFHITDIYCDTYISR